MYVAYPLILVDAATVIGRERKRVKVPYPTIAGWVLNGRAYDPRIRGKQ